MSFIYCHHHFKLQNLELLFVQRSILTYRELGKIENSQCHMEGC